MKEKIKKYLGEILIVLGAAVFTYNFFRLISKFSITASNYSVTKNPEALALPPLPGLPYIYNLIEETTYSISFGYSVPIFGLTAGVVLLVTGILIIKNRGRQA